MKKIYIASGWFSKEQVIRLKEMEDVVQELNFDMYSPRKESIYKPGDDHKAIVRANVANLHKCNMVLASTEGKDMGTLFECGYAAAIHKPVVYYFPSDVTFNIMLADTAQAVIRSKADLFQYLEGYSRSDILGVQDFEGDME